MRSKRTGIIFTTVTMLTVVLFVSLLFYGSVSIPASEVWAALTGRDIVPAYVATIVWETRFPMAVAALCCGVALSIAGLMMQSLFRNPLAGPSVLGVSSGASFGVAVLILGASGFGGVVAGWQPYLSVIGAILGGMMTIAILYGFSSILKSAVSLLIVGIMIGYLCSSGISLLNYFSRAEAIRNFLVWGLGSFASVRFDSAILLLILTIVFTAPTLWFVKPLNALLLGERYMESVGFSARKIRGSLLISAGILTAVPTAFCGPIGFIGLIVPHLCRLLFKSSNHLILIPASIVCGSALSLACALLSVIPSAVFGVLPINVITPFIGVPVILYLLVNRKRLPYFS